MRYTIVVALLLALTAGAQARTLVHMVYVDPATSPVDRGASAFKRLLETSSHGQLEVELHPGGDWRGEHLDELDILRRVRTGEIEAAIVTSAPCANYSHAIEMLDTPFLFNDYPHVDHILDGPIGQSLLEGLVSSGMHGLSYMDSGFRIITSSRPITHMADLKDKRIRVMQSDIYSMFIRLVGAVPVPSAVSKINEMAAKGYIDAADRSYPTYWEFHLNHEHKYILESNHAYAAEVLLINDAAFKRLSPAEQRELTESANAASLVQRREFRTEVERVKVACRKDGVEIRTITSTDRKDMRTLCQPIYDRLLTQYGDTMKRLMAANTP